MVVMKRRLVDICIARRGVRLGAIAALRTAQWAIVAADVGHMPSSAEYESWTGCSERTAWRHRAAIRDTFGDDWQAVVADLARMIGRRRSPGVVMQFAVEVAS